VSARLALAVGLIVWALPAAPAFSQDARTVVADATRAMGAGNLTSILLTGAALQGNFGQSRTITFGLATTSIKNYQVAIDFAAAALRATGDGEPSAPGRRGGAAPPAAPYEQTAVAGSAWRDQFHIWVTPWGFLRGAAANTPSVRATKVGDVAYKVVTWSPPQKAPSGKAYRVVGYINPQQMVDRVETWVDHPIFGDLHVDTTYTGFQDASGLKVPARSAQKLAGMETFVTSISRVEVNPPDITTLVAGPAPVAEPPAPPPVSEKLAEGVYRIVADYVSLAVEFKDHVVVLEAGPSEARALAVIAETKRLFPTKPIRFVVNTHPHFDHSAGLAPFIAQGVTVVTDDNCKFFVEAAFSEPRTLANDLLSKSRKKPKVAGVIDTFVLKDETRALELYHVDDLDHTDAMLVALLPRERILFTADFNVPRSGQPVSPSIATLVANLDRLKLDFDRHVMVHPPNPDRPMTRADLYELATGGR
jgi:glyoxylase-like metal-dependent hydrolase (beta-lactamase superfamily II)